MLEAPFEIIECSWPRPVEQTGDCWVSEPEWDAPLMPCPPHFKWLPFNGEPCLGMNWCESFQGNLKRWNSYPGGEMRGFHIVFRLRVKANGNFVFWDDDGSIIRRDGEIIHCDRTTHALTRHEITVKENDMLEVAQWQNYGGWLWGANLYPETAVAEDLVSLFLPYLAQIKEKLSHPDGPVLKMYFHGSNPFCTILSLYSMVLNGYRPSQVLVFGEYQWSNYSREIFDTLLPFAKIVPTAQVLEEIRRHGEPRLADLALRFWFVMKTCISLLYPPQETCLMDDDVFILDRVDLALKAFRENDLVFAPDADYSDRYEPWRWLHGQTATIATGSFNAGLYWMRNLFNPKRLASDMLKVWPWQVEPMVWEQGFIASSYAQQKIYRLPTQPYFYPYFDGLPGGMLGYDYANNPCRFVSVHFGGLSEKPVDKVALALVSEILGRGRS